MTSPANYLYPNRFKNRPAGKCGKENKMITIKNYFDIQIKNNIHISADLIADVAKENLKLNISIFVPDIERVLSKTELPVYVYNGKPELFFDEGEEFHACFDSIDAMVYRKRKQAFVGIGTEEITADIMLTGLSVDCF